jgi:hypothetical protein
MTRALPAILVAVVGCGSVELIGHTDSGTDVSPGIAACPVFGGECCTIDQTGCNEDEVCVFMATADCTLVERCLPGRTWECERFTPCDFGYCCEGRACMRWRGEDTPTCHIMCRDDADCPPTDFWHCSDPGIGITFPRTGTCSGEVRVPYGYCERD